MSNDDASKGEDDVYVRKAPQPASRIVQTSVVDFHTAGERELQYDNARDMLFFGPPLGKGSLDFSKPVSVTLTNGNRCDLGSAVFDQQLTYNLQLSSGMVSPYGEEGALDLVLKVYDTSTVYGDFSHIFYGENVKSSSRSFVKSSNRSFGRKVNFSIGTEMLVSKTDRRSFVSETGEMPYSAFWRLMMRFDDHTERVYMGSGFLVGPRHFITAAHNVYDKHASRFSESQWSSEIEVSSAEGVLSKVAAAFISKKWLNGDVDNDVALLVLKNPVGNYTGWVGVFGIEDENYLEKLEINVTGYPGELYLKDSKGVMLTMSGKIARVSNEKIFYTIDTSPGQSGSPVWIKIGDTFQVIGIHTGANVGSVNFRKRFLPDEISVFQKIISNTFQ